MNTMKFIAAQQLLGQKQVYRSFNLDSVLMSAMGIDRKAYRNEEQYRQDLRLTVAQALRRGCTSQPKREADAAEFDEVFNDILSVLEA